jgi:hypothetical protein
MGVLASVGVLTVGEVNPPAPETRSRARTRGGLRSASANVSMPHKPQSTGPVRWRRRSQNRVMNGLDQVKALAAKA